jgi:hypothetical protein
VSLITNLSRIISFLEEVMFWWMPFLPLFDPFNVASDQREYADEKAQSSQGDNRNRPQPKSAQKAKRKASSKGRKTAATRKGAGKKAARKK